MAQFVVERDQFGEFWPVFQKPLHPAPESLEVLKIFLFKDLNGDKGKKPDQGACLERDRSSVNFQLVVIKSVRLVPEAGAAQPVHRVGDRHEMLLT